MSFCFEESDLRTWLDIGQPITQPCQTSETVAWKLDWSTQELKKLWRSEGDLGLIVTNPGMWSETPGGRKEASEFAKESGQASFTIILSI